MTGWKLHSICCRFAVQAFTLACFLGACDIALARVEVDAVAGMPFGVARVSLQRRDVPGPIDESAIQIQESGGRAFYPATRVNRVGRVIGELLGTPEGEVDSVVCSFLFTGDTPFDITLQLPDPVTITIVPRANERDLNRLLAPWWRDYHAMLRDLQEEGDYPPLAHTYLLAMLAERLRLRSPQLDRELRATSSPGQEVLELLAGTEQVRERIALESLLGGADAAAATLPSPPEIAWPELLPAVDEKVAIEPIAMHIPADCAYIRFGRFSNFLWFNNLLEEYGGDLARLVSTRGFTQPLNEKTQQQLQLKQDALAELLGETIIADVALIGRDFYFQEGSSTGLLFHAKQSAILNRDLTGKRLAAFNQEKEAGATLQKVTIADREVSFLSTPDNRIRSYYAVDGDFHLVTNTKAIVESFFATGKGKTSLGDTAEFRFARSRLPTDRNDTVFVYLSTGFLRGLASHHYQIELRRRLQSVVDMQHAQLGRLAARGEGRKADTIEDLVAGGFVAPGFGRRPDGSGLILTDRGAVDSLRGARGTFTPVPDIEIRSVTPTELSRCEAQEQYYRQHWKQLDPLYIGIGRFKLNDKGLERITAAAHIAPFEETKYGWLTSSLGPAVGTRITSAPGDVIQVQAFLKGGLLDNSVGPHHMFLGVQDHVPLATLRSGNLLQILQLLRTTPGYLGAWPKTGFLDRLPLRLGGGEPDPWGYSRLMFGLWRRQGDGFSVLSFDRDLLAKVTPHLAVAEGDEQAQIRVHVGNLAESNVASLVNGLYYEQARRTSVGNARLMTLLQQQFHVPIDDARLAAEELLMAKLVCTLGGDYKIRQWPGGGESWASTAWPEHRDQEIPAEYTSPLLSWFRGLEAGLVKHPDQLMVNLQLDMQRHRQEKASLDLPVFNFNLFGGEKNKTTPPATGTPTPAELPPPRKLFPNNPPPPPEPSGPGASSGQGKVF